ncbi:MAG: glycosyltransferase family A protein [Spirochaetota bacterium]
MDAREKLVSVIIPAYNRESVITRSIESVVKQSYTYWELLLIDDGSSDSSGQKMQSYVEKYPGKIYLHSLDTNKGVSQARNLGIHKAKGEWLAFLDSDDEWLPDKLYKQIEFHRQNPKYQLSQTQEIWYRNGKRVNSGKKHRKQAGFVFPQCLKLCAITPSSVFLKKEIFTNHAGFANELPACEDYELWLRLAAKLEVGLLEEALLIRYAGHKDQLSNRYPAMDRFRIYALAKLLQQMPWSDQLFVSVRNELQQKWHVLQLGMAKRGKQSASLDELLQQCQEKTLSPEGFDKLQNILLQEKDWT